MTNSASFLLIDLFKLSSHNSVLVSCMFLGYPFLLGCSIFHRVSYDALCIFGVGIPS